MYARVRVRVCVCVCVRERERERESVCVCVCVCVCASKRACMSSERERENMCVHACVHYVDVKVHSMLDVYCCDQRATRARVRWGKKTQDIKYTCH